MLKKKKKFQEGVGSTTALEGFLLLCPWVNLDKALAGSALKQRLGALKF